MEKMNVLYDGVLVEGIIKNDGVYVFDESICGEVRIGSLEQCENEFSELKDITYEN